MELVRGMSTLGYWVRRGGISVKGDALGDEEQERMDTILLRASEGRTGAVGTVLGVEFSPAQLDGLGLGHA